MNATAASPSGQPHSVGRVSAVPVLPLILLGYLVLAITLSFIIPLGEAADEVSHRAYAGEISTNHRLPSASGPASGEAFQPPLYYGIAALLTAWIPDQNMVVLANPDATLAPGGAPNLLLHTADEAWPFSNSAVAWHLMRLLSIALGAVTIWATYCLAQGAFPARPQVAWGAAAFVAFLPGFLVISTAVSNDNLIIALSALIVWQLVRMLSRPLRLRDAAILGMLLGLAALAKLSGFIFWGLSALVLLWLSRDRASRRMTIGAAALIFLLALCISAPWLLRNLQLDGDVLAYARMLNVTPRLSPMTLADWRQYTVSMYTSFWGRFGGASHHWLPIGVYAALSLVPILAVVGTLRGKSAAGPESGAASSRWMPAFLLLAGCILLASHMRITVVLAGQDLARQVLPALAPVAVVLALGVSKLTSKNGAALIALGAGMAVYAVLFVAFVASTYTAQPQSVSLLPPMGNHVPADFGGQLRLVDYSVEQQSAVPGDEIAVTTSFQALASPADVYWLLLRLVGPQGTVATVDGVPANGDPTTDLWRAGQAFVSHHVLTVPPATPDGVYRLELGLHSMGRWQWLPVEGQDTLVLSEINIEN